MLINADATLYEKGSFKRHELHEIYWNDSRGASVSKNGVQTADCVVVYVYSDEYIPKAGDIIVNGITDFEFDSTSQQTARDSINRFREMFPMLAVVKNVNNCMYGNLPHIELTAR